MSRRLVLLLSLLTSVVTACSGDDGGSLFDGTTGTVPEPVATVSIEALGRSWELPGAICLRTDADRAIVLAVAQQQAAQVHSLVGHLVSGWPTTTYALDFDYESYERDLHTAAVSALTLARLLGEKAALEKAWEDWEEGFADPGGGWGPPSEISGRLPQWEVDAGTLAAAVAAHCAG
jgi:hypothetical protein